MHVLCMFSLSPVSRDGVEKAGQGGSDNCIKFHLVCFFALCSISKEVSIFSSGLVNYLRLHNIPARRISQGCLWKFLKIFKKIQA